MRAANRWNFEKRLEGLRPAVFTGNSLSTAMAAIRERLKSEVLPLFQ
jgi:hypothetical protein